ncbi:ABC transporter ATP-binding protein [Methylibium rhizosphaerae]|uniref:ABC transporter ATP-binding protein n=1 Tax=Methylibium rhizosphaerae TaxID=2570323 RepID=UPI00112A9269|nr:sn-glycerol-3-phosphate ABC transporter ATP-binding protein UgpC [Methylibium rhizosphaerae]
MASVSLRKLCKQFGSNTVLRDVDLEIADGEFVVMVGPSGCGKSTVLNCIAGLQEVTSGEVWIGGRLVNEVPPKDRDIAMVFQSYALFPNMDVRHNITFGMEMRKVPKPEQETRLAKVAQLLQITDLLDRRPAQLSGGQRQRVAMGRAMVREPAVFLFDEPLSNLDAKLRVQMRAELKALHQRLRQTVVYVTHDQVEAMTLADRIVVMNAGRVEQVGTPLQLYDRPVNQFVAGFIGSPAMNFIAGTVQRAGSDLQLVTREGARFPLPRVEASEGSQVTLGVRPEHLAPAEAGPVSLKVDIVEPTGDMTNLYGRVADELVCVCVHHRLAVTPGQTVMLQWPLEHVRVFDAQGRRLPVQGE